MLPTWFGNGGLSSRSRRANISPKYSSNNNRVCVCEHTHSCNQRAKSQGVSTQGNITPTEKTPMARILLWAIFLCAWLTPFSVILRHVCICCYWLQHLCYTDILFINPWNDTLPGKSVLVDRNKSRLFKWHYPAVVSIFLGHPKYPNTVDADWKAHKEDMMHRPKWRGHIRTLKTPGQSLYRWQQTHSPRESTAFCTARSQNWESILDALYVRIYVNLLFQFPKMNEVTEASNLICSTTPIWFRSLLCFEYSFIT